MKKFKLLLFSVVVAALTLVGVVAGFGTNGAQAGPVLAVDGKVSIYLPTKPAVSKKPRPQVARAQKTTIIVIRERFYRPFFTRQERLARSIRNRYPSFTGQYSGPKYPF